MAFFEPDRYISRITMIDVKQDLIGRGFAHVLLDIDNTILTRDTHEVPRDVGLWLACARDAGIGFCLLSNNWHRGVHQLARRLELPLVSHAMKPLPPAFLIALRKMGASRKATLVVGDQLMTDVVGAHLLGMKAYLVCPLVEHDLKHTLILRNAEALLIGHLQPEGLGCQNSAPLSPAQPSAAAQTPAPAQPPAAAWELAPAQPPVPAPAPALAQPLAPAQPSAAAQTPAPAQPPALAQPPADVQPSALAQPPVPAQCLAEGGARHG
ncbi:MAG: HAD hydrolase-like protein [Coriobacteriaceae bacterium]|jgi:HAD superfamily phosphatase (TIGR01668 family)|nr:HAD hydrolase-like protein [Coriobacteriaceae bacterium]